MINWDAAADSPIRSHVFWSTLDSRKELNAYTHRSLMEKGRWAYENISFVGRIVDCMATKTVGSGFTLGAATEDEEWNLEREKLWANRMGSAKVMDLAGRDNFSQYLKRCSRALDTDGEMFVLLSETQDEDESLRRARYKLIEASRIGQGIEMRNKDPYKLGVRTDVHGRELAYRFLAGKLNGKDLDVGASSMLHFWDTPRVGTRRGISKLGRILNDALDHAETKGFLKHKAKVASEFGVVTKGGAKMGPRARDMMTRGGKEEERFLKDVFGKSGKILELGDSGGIEVIESKTPSPETMNLLDHLIRHVSVGYGLPYELVWNMAKMGSAGVRYMLRDALEFISGRQQLLVDQVASPMYVYDTAKLIRSGMIREPNDPEWWKHGWLMPEKLTIDISKDGKHQLDQHRRAFLTMKSLYGCQGLAWKQQIDQWMIEREYVLDSAMAVAERLNAKYEDANFGVDRVLPPEPGAPALSDSIAEAITTTREDDE